MGNLLTTYVGRGPELAGFFFLYKIKLDVDPFHSLNFASYFYPFRSGPALSISMRRITRRCFSMVFL